METLKTKEEKAIQWIGTAEVGLSSKTMWNCFMGNEGFQIWHPSDPDDFSRCYKLLQAVPELKEEMYKLKLLSKLWSDFVDNWDELTEMYEENERTNWVNYKKIGMYEFIQKIYKQSRISTK